MASKRQKQNIAWFQQHFGITHKYRRFYYYGTCPNCAKNRLVLNIYDNSVKCWRCFPNKHIAKFAQEFGYDYSYSELQDLDLYSIDFIQEKSIRKVEPTINDLPPTSKLLIEYESDHAAFKYLRNVRKLPEYVIEYISTIAYVQEEFKKHSDGEYYYNRLIFPMMNDNGDIIAFTARDFSGNQAKHKVSGTMDKKGDIFNIDALYNYSNNAIAYGVEGSFDACFFKYKGFALNNLDIGERQFEKMLMSPVKHLVFISDVGSRTNTDFFDDWRVQLLKGFANSDKYVYITQPVKPPINSMGKSKYMETDIGDYYKEVQNLDFLRTALSNKMLIHTPVINFFTTKS